MALNLRPYDRINNITELITSPDCDTWYLDARDAWFMLDQSIDHIFNWLNMTIVAHRWPLWLEVYNQWRRFHYQRTRFFWYFPQIIKAIVQGHDIDLRRLELDLVQESIIQHELIYKHGLNLKTFGLEKFSNTKQLHHLLESNQHQVGIVANTDIDNAKKNNQEAV